MTIEIMIIIGVVAAIGAFLVAGIIGFLFGRSYGPDRGYWNGRLAGWQECENLILERAEENSDYDKKKIWEDLVQ